MFACALLAWMRMIGVEIVHGVLRRLYLVPLVGTHRAGQIGVVIGYSIAYIADDFNPLAGWWMLFGLLVMLLAPRLVARRG